MPSSDSDNAQLNQNVTPLIERIQALSQTRERILIAVAGPPGAGKTSFAAKLVTLLNNIGTQAATVPMDGFHFDNAVLEKRNLMARKGSPETFDVDGLALMLKRLQSEHDVAIPIFDRSLDLARMSAYEITNAHRVLIVEGNYLLLDREPWVSMRATYRCTVWISAARPVLETRLVQRWIDHGLVREAAEHRARNNDMVNVDLVLNNSAHPQFSFLTS